MFILSSIITFILALLTIGLGFILCHWSKKDHSTALCIGSIILIVGGLLALAYTSYYSFECYSRNGGSSSYPSMMNERIMNNEMMEPRTMMKDNTMTPNTMMNRDTMMSPDKTESRP